MIDSLTGTGPSESLLCAYWIAFYGLSYLHGEVKIRLGVHPEAVLSLC